MAAPRAAGRVRTRREGLAWVGYGLPLIAAGLTAWVFFGPGRFDATPLRLSLEVFGTAAAIGAVWPARTGHVGTLAFAAAGLAATGLGAMATMGPLTWLASALCVVAIVDAAYAADRTGQSLGRVPAVGAAAGLGVSLVVHAIL